MRMDAAPFVLERRTTEFGAHLRRVCIEAAGMPGPRNRVTVTCTAAEALLPTGMAVRLGLIAGELIANALDHAFPSGRGGRVAVAFEVEDGAWRLTVEDSGVGRAAAESRLSGLQPGRDLAGEVGGRLRIVDLIGGTRCSVVGTQPQASAFAKARRDTEDGRDPELERPFAFND